MNWHPATGMLLMFEDAGFVDVWRIIAPRDRHLPTGQGSKYRGHIPSLMREWVTAQVLLQNSSDIAPVQNTLRPKTFLF